MSRFVKMALLFSTVLCALVLSAVAASAAPESELPYWIHVSRTKQIVTVYSTADNSLVRQMICTTGAASTPTIKGTFYMPKKKYSYERGPWYYFGTSLARYGTRIKDGYLFHSILYSNSKKLNVASWNLLGRRGSHGCIRLTPIDAQWIAYNCAAGTKVVINDKSPAKGVTNSSQLKKLLPPARNGKVGAYEPTLTPTPKPTPPTLSEGIEGERTKRIQSSLKYLGHFAGAVNGKFGSDTTEAVKSFQRAFLALYPSTTVETAVDGVATPTWQSRINSNKSNASLAATNRTLKYGHSGIIVKLLRIRLKELGYTTQKAGTSFDKNTRVSIQLFQRASGLSITGIATPEVQNLLLSDEAAAAPIAQVSNARSIALRKSASSKSSLVARLREGFRLRVIREYGEWTYVRAGSKLGYVQTSFLTYEEPQPTPTPAPQASPAPTPAPVTSPAPVQRPLSSAA